MSILVVGSIAFDTVKSPEGESREALGGSAVYFSLAAGFFTGVKLVGAVGNDFPLEHRNMLAARGVNIDGLEVLDGKTFRWSGSYLEDLNEAKTISTCLNVFAEFNPSLPETCREADTVFLANIAPKLQLSVLDQVKGCRIVACDTMNYWITNEKKPLIELLGKCDIFLLNEMEARQLTGKDKLQDAACIIQEYGPSRIVIKRGENGALLICGSETFVVPSYPVKKVKDPTGAGDSFAGGMLGYLDSLGNRKISENEMFRAALHGAAVASICVEDFGVGGHLRAGRDEILRRVAELDRNTAIQCRSLGSVSV